MLDLLTFFIGLIILLLIIFFSQGCGGGSRIFISQTPSGPALPAILSVDLKVADLGEKDEKIDFADSLTTEPGHLLRFRLEIKNTGNGMAEGLKVKVTLPTYFIYQMGSTEIGTAPADTICGDGISISFLPPQTLKAIEFSVVIDDLATEGNYEVKAEAEAVNHPPVTDPVSVHIKSTVLVIVD